MKISAGMGVLPLLSAGSALAADFGDRVEYRMQRHGDHIDQRLDRHGERLQASLDRRGDRTERHWDRRGACFDRRFDQHLFNQDPDRRL